MFRLMKMESVRKWNEIKFRHNYHCKPVQQEQMKAVMMEYL